MAKAGLVDIDLASGPMRVSLSNWISQKLPSESTRIVDILPISGGQSNVTYRIKIEQVLDGKRSYSEFALRWELTEGPAAPYDIEYQYRVFDSLHGSDVPVPRTYWMEHDTSIIGRRFWVLEFVEAESVGRLLDMSQPHAAARLEAFILTLANVHQVDWKSRGMDKFCRMIAGQSILDLIDKQKLFRSGVASHADAAIFEGARTWLHANVPNVEMRLNHGDCNLSNFMFRGTKVAAVVDWEFASIGDPLMDVGYYCALVYRFRKTTSRSQLELERQDFLRRYQMRTGSLFGTLLYWEIFANFRNGLSWTNPALAVHAAGGYEAYRDRLRELLPTVSDSKQLGRETNTS
jgi:aminoglycoside phosphotransferase (APT) family kinase protein